MTDNKENAPEPTAPEEKKKAKKATKKKGPIRWEAIIPFCAFIAVVWGYFAFFFDSHIRRALEFVGTHANGAEVNIDDIDTSFWGAALVIRNIQVTDVDQPAFNKVQIGQVRWKMIWEALLRGKIAIADASILEIGIGTQRKRPGRVLPKDPPGTKSAAENLREKAIDEAKKRFQDNVLGDIASILDGADPKEQLKNIGDSLASQARVKELQAELKLKEQQWKERLENLPQSKYFKDVDQRLKGVKLDGFKDPTEVQASVKEIDSILKDVDAKVKETQATGKAVGSDLDTYSKAIKDLEAMVQKDVKDLENRLKIPKLDVGNLAASMFAHMLLTKVRQAKFYMEKARDYLPPKKSDEEKAAFKPPTPRERIAGRDYKFGRPNSYPLFWLQKAEISSKESPSIEWSGNLRGTLTNLTDSPAAIGQPTILKFEGDFPKQELAGVLGEVVIDHVTSKPRESLTMKVGTFKVKGQQLSDSNDVKLAFADAIGSSEFKVELQEEAVSLTTINAFNSVTYNVEAKNKLVDEMLENILKSVPKVTVDAGVKGTWSNLDFSFDTNLARELQKGFETEIKAKIAEARAKIKAYVDERIAAEKAKLQAEYKKIEDKVKGEITAKQAEIDKLKNQLEEGRNKALKDSKKKIENEGKEKLKDVLKGKKLKF